MFKYVIVKICLKIMNLIYMYKKNLALNDQQWLIYPQTKQNKTKLPVNGVCGPEKKKKTQIQNIE